MKELIDTITSNKIRRNQMSVKIGSAKYGGDYVKKKYAKLKDGESVYRIVPPIGELAERGIWSVFHKVHYGYKNSEGKMRPFVSPLVQNRNTKMIEQPDAALEFINKGKAELEKAKAAGNAALVEALNKKFGPKGQYNLDSNHYMNAIDTQGNIVILKIRHRAMLALKATIDSLRAEGVDPLSVEDGRFFSFRRTGNGLETTFQVNVLKEKLNVPGVGEVQRDVVHKLTPDLIDRLGKEAGDLNKLFKRPTSEEVARIVKEGARAVDEILNTSTKGSASEEPEDTYEDESEYEQPAAANATAQPTTVAQTTQAAPAAAPAPSTTAQTTPQTAAPKVESLSTPAKTTAQAINEQSDADFLKSLGLG
jgi:hypothetical protein